ncbi:MAG TPA: DUF202 domain-containing protein [Gemmatimonadales bacterium]|nr:DUF202 domain-containing protein [Gemmatimonadales bacterium]
MHLEEWLAQELTALSNERTLLAYLRTAAALAAMGLGLIRFFEAQWLAATGGVLVLLGLACGAWGIRRFVYVRRIIAAASRR